MAAQRSKDYVLALPEWLERCNTEEIGWLHKFSNLSTRHQKWMYLLMFGEEPEKNMSETYFFNRIKNSKIENYLNENKWREFDRLKITRVHEDWIDILDKRKLLFLFLDIYLCFLRTNNKEVRIKNPKKPIFRSVCRFSNGDEASECYNSVYNFDFFGESDLDLIRERIFYFLISLDVDDRSGFIKSIQSKINIDLIYSDLSYFTKVDSKKRVDFLYSYVFESFDNFKKYKRDDMLSKFRELELMTYFSDIPVHSLEDKLLISKVIIEKISNEENRNLFIKNLMAAAYQKEHRDKQKRKSKYHLALTKDSKKKLSKMADSRHKSEADMVNDIIQNYYEINFKKDGKDMY